MFPFSGNHGIFCRLLLRLRHFTFLSPHQLCWVLACSHHHQYWYLHYSKGLISTLPWKQFSLLSSVITPWLLEYSSTVSFFLYLFQFSTHHGNSVLTLDSGPDALCWFHRDLLHEFKSQTHGNDAQTVRLNCDIFCKSINLYLTALEILMMILISLKLTEWSSWSCSLNKCPQEQKFTLHLPVPPTPVCSKTEAWCVPPRMCLWILLLSYSSTVSSKAMFSFAQGFHFSSFSFTSINSLTNFLLFLTHHVIIIYSVTFSFLLL